MSKSASRMVFLEHLVREYPDADLEDLLYVWAYSCWKVDAILIEAKRPLLQ